MLGKSWIAVFSQWFVVADVRTGASLKRRVRKVPVEQRHEKSAKRICKSKRAKNIVAGPILPLLMHKDGTPLWREAHYELIMYKTPQARTNLRNAHPHKSYATVARSTLASQNGGSNFWSSDAQKLHAAVARSRSKCAKHHMFGTTFWSSDVQKSHASVAPSAFVSQILQKTCVLPHFLKFRCRKISALAPVSKFVSQSMNESVSNFSSYSVSLFVRLVSSVRHRHLVLTPPACQLACSWS